MPATQRGRVDRKRGSWRARWSDEAGKQREKRGFRTKSEARAWVDGEVDRVARLRRGELVPDPLQIPTLQELVDEYLGQHRAEANTIKTLRERLKYATKTFGSLRVDRLTVREIAAWRGKLPAGSVWHIHKALRQVLNYAVAARYLDRNVARDVANPEPKRRAVPIFQTPAEVDLVAAELGVAHRAIPILAAETGLRPEEWLALERRDVQIDKELGIGVVHVRRVYTDGEVKDCGKNDRSLRSVALTRRAVTALEATPRRIDTPLLFPGARGGYLNLHNWRADEWTPAVKAAGLHVDEYQRPVKLTPYTLRHTYAAWSIAAGIDTFTLARRMGTSVEQIDKTYGHLLHDSIDRERDVLQAWVDGQEAIAEKQARA